MTALLTKVVKRLEAMPEPRQDELAALMLRQIEEEQQWAGVAATALGRAYSEDEPEYGEYDVKE